MKNKLVTKEIKQKQLIIRKLNIALKQMGQILNPVDVSNVSKIIFKNSNVFKIKKLSYYQSLVYDFCDTENIYESLWNLGFMSQDEYNLYLQKVGA